jgi:antitoxin ParD1/3/4
MNVSLTPELEQLIHKKVERGLYLSSSEVVREALRLLEEQDRLDVIKLEELRREIQIGVDQAYRGELLDGPNAFATLRKKVRTGNPSRRGKPIGLDVRPRVGARPPRRRAMLVAPGRTVALGP